MMNLLIATQNPGKLREYREMLTTPQLSGLPIQLFTPADVGLEQLTVEETGATFAENAELKAFAYMQPSGMFALADDSGLEVDALGGAPGVLSARYGGPGATDADRRRKLLEALQGVPEEQRTARFVCVIVVANPQTNSPALVRGTCEGRIAQQEADGGFGFGYDALFIPHDYPSPDGIPRTFAQISPPEKHRLSHRGRALQQLLPVLARLARG